MLIRKGMFSYQRVPRLENTRDEMIDVLTNNFYSL